MTKKSRASEETEGTSAKPNRNKTEDKDTIEIDISNDNEGTFPCKTALITNIPDKNTTMKKSCSKKKKKKKKKRDYVAIEPTEKDNNGKMNTYSNNGNSKSLS